LADGLSGDCHAVQIECANLAQMQHDFRNSAGQVDLNCFEKSWPIGKHIDNSANLAVDINPIIDRWPFYSSAMGDRRDVQEQIRRTPEGRMNRQGVSECAFSQDLRKWDSIFLEIH